MKIKFVQQHIIRGAKPSDNKTYEKDQVVDFVGAVEESYARAYIRRGHAVEFDEATEKAAAANAREATAKAEKDAKIAKLAAVKIPEDYADLPAADLREIAVQLTDDTVKNKEEALDVIEAELKRRGA